MLVSGVASTSVGRKLLVAVAGVCMLGFLTFVLLVGVVVTMMGANPPDSLGSSQPSTTAVADIPADMLALYMAAGKKYGIDWAVIAAIGKIESDHCRSTSAGVSSGNNSKGAGGCMQFLQDTFDQYGVDGDGDGRASRYSKADSVMSTANYLKASGAPDNYHDAIFTYNHAEWYVSDILKRAEMYRGALRIGIPDGSAPGSLGALAGSPSSIVNSVVAYAHNHGFPNVTAESVRLANATHGPTVSGRRSDHQGPPDVAWAADMSNGTSPTPGMDALARVIASAFRIPWNGSGLVNKIANGYQLQLIYRTMEGGNHFNHVHFGVKKL
jgi:Transglycosylase SLT domain